MMFSWWYKLVGLVLAVTFWLAFLALTGLLMYSALIAIFR